MDPKSSASQLLVLPAQELRAPEEWSSEVVTQAGLGGMVIKRSCWLGDPVSLRLASGLQQRGRSKESGHRIWIKHGWWSGGPVPTLGQSSGFQLQLQTRVIEPVFLICETEMLTGLCTRVQWDSQVQNVNGHESMGRV